jgi:predicted nucleic acid-binding protein
MSWEMEKQFFDIVKIDERLTECAIMTLKSKGLRALDSIQLASAIHVMCDEFVVSDKRLFKAANEILPGSVTFIG